MDSIVSLNPRRFESFSFKKPFLLRFLQIKEKTPIKNFINTTNRTKFSTKKKKKGEKNIIHSDKAG